MTLGGAIAAAVVLGGGAGLVAWWLPTPSSLVGTIAVGLSVALLVVVAYLGWRVRNDEQRLARIERLLMDEVHRGR